MIDALTLAVMALAGWRVAYMLTNEDGPANVFGWLRRHIQSAGSEYSATAGVYEIQPGSFEKLFSCVYCMSFWTTAAVALLWAVDNKAGRDAIFVVASWGAATALDMIARRDG